MIKRIISGIVLAGAMVGMLFLWQVSQYFFDALITAAILMGLYELIRLFRQDMTVSTIVTIALYALSIYPAYLFLGGVYGTLLMSLAFFILMNVVVLFDKKAEFKTVLDFLFMMFYPTLLIALVYPLNYNESGLVLLTLLFAVSSVTDTMALVSGMLIGGKKLCPSISPKKTIAGAVGGLIFGTGTGMLVYVILQDFVRFQVAIPMLLLFALLGLIGSVCTQIGDLIASNLKRKMQIKDFGNLIPGHGGLIDRIDGIMLNAAFLFLFTMFL